MQTTFDLRQWVRNCHRPVIMVSTTPNVEDICGKNNLNLVQLLKPFEKLDNLKSEPIRIDNGPTGKRIQSLSVRFVSFSEVNIIPDIHSDKYLSGYCKSLAPQPPIQLSHLRNGVFQNQSHGSSSSSSSSSSGSSSSSQASITNTNTTTNVVETLDEKNNIDERNNNNNNNNNNNESISNKITNQRSTIPQTLRICSRNDVDRFFEQNPDPTPWFWLYHGQFLEMLRHSPYDFIDAPIAAIYVASTRDEDCVKKLKWMSQPDNLPSKFRNGIYSKDIYKVFLLIHDKHDAHLRENIKPLFEDVRRAFGQFNYKLLHINSIAENAPNLETSDLWRAYINPNFPPSVPILNAFAVSNARRHRKIPLEEVIQDPKDLQSSPERSWSHGYNIKSPKCVNKAYKTPLHGMYLNEEDLTILNQIVTDIVLIGILPFVERKVRDLYQVVAQERKGLSQTFKRLFTTKKPKAEIQQKRLDRARSNTTIPKPPSTTSNQPSSQSSTVLRTTETDSNIVEEESPLYNLESIESAIRQLADLCFIMQQYEIALEHYKLVINDYKADGCREHMAGALEMGALCAALLSKPTATPSWMRLRNFTEEPSIANIAAYNNNRRDMESFFDSAFNEYVEISDIRRGTRTSMWAWMAHCSLGHSFNHEMISKILLRPSERETKHRSAMLLEQAAFAYLRAGPDRSPMIRKYAFHLILAAHLYKECDQKEHSIRCYSSAIMVYAERGWSHVEDHINYNLGYLSAKMNRTDAAIEYFLELLGAGRGSATRQKNFLEKFLAIIGKWNTDSRIMTDELGSLASRSIASSLKFVPNLNIPKFHPFVDVIVHHPDEMPTNAIEAVWRHKLRQDYNFLSSHRLRQGKVEITRGENITVKVQVTNPLKRELTVSHLCLHCVVKGALSSNNDNLLLGYDDLFVYNPVFLTLQSEESKQVSVSVSIQHPIMDGLEVEIVGLRWQIFNCMQGFHRFNRALIAVKSTSSISPAAFLSPGPKAVAQFESDHKAIHHFLKDVDKRIDFKFHIKSPQACLHCHTYEGFSFPHSIYHGELVPVVLGLSNTGTLTATNIRLRLNLPQLMCISKLNRALIHSLSTINEKDDSEMLMKWLDDMEILYPAKLEEYTKGSTSTNKGETPTIDGDFFKRRASTITSINEINKFNKQYEEDVLCLNENIESGQITYIVLWLQGAIIGDFLLQLLIGYDSLVSSSISNDQQNNNNTNNPYQTPQRLICLSRQLLVEPLLNMALFTRNHFGDIRQYILGIEIENVTNDILLFPGKANEITCFGLVNWLENESTNNTCLGISALDNNSLGYKDETNSNQLAQLQPLLTLGDDGRGAIAMIANSIQSELDNEQKRNTLRATLDTEKLPWIVIKDVTCIAENWSVQALIENDKLTPVKGQSNSTVFMKLMPVDNESKQEYDMFVLDRDYIISTHHFDVQEEKSVIPGDLNSRSLLRQTNSKEDEMIKKMLSPARGVVNSFIKKKFQQWLDRIQLITKACGRTPQRHLNELEIITTFEITESPKLLPYLDNLTNQRSMSASSSLATITDSSLTASSPAPKTDNVMDDHPLDMTSKVYTDTSQTMTINSGDNKNLQTRPNEYLNTGSNNNQNDKTTDDKKNSTITREQMEIKMNNDLANFPKILRQKRFGFHMLNEPFVFSQVESHTGCPLRVAIQYPKTLPMTPKDRRVSCDVDLMVLNISRKFLVSFVFETLAQNEEFDNNTRSFVTQKEPALRARYQWFGNTSFEQQKLPPGGYINIKLRAEFDTPGIYNLNRYRFSVKSFTSEEGTNVPAKIFFFPMQHLIAIGAK